MAPERERALLAGRVGRPHGLDGSFHVSDARGDLLAEGTDVAVGGRPARIERRAGTAQRPIVRLSGCAQRDDAEALRGQPIELARTAAPGLGPEEWWIDELEGCVVHDAGHELGVVAGVLVLPSCEALQVRREGADELLVPLVSDAVRTVDVSARRIDVDSAFLGAD